MTKKDVTLTIDQDILEPARKQIPNLSQFFENCLKAYLGVDINTLFYTSNAQEALDTIKQAQTSLYLLIERNNVEENIKKAEHDEINLAWRKLYAEYRDTKHINKTQRQNSSKILNIPEEELTDIVEVTYVFRNETKIDITEWEEVYNEYGYNDE